MRSFFLFSLFSAVLATAGQSIPWNEPGFTLGSLQNKSTSGLFFFDPSRFGMQQSYSVSFSSSGAGSHSSGVYLNTLSYDFGIPVRLSVDVGVYNMFHSNFHNQMLQDRMSQGGHAPQFLLPRIGLEYQPTENVLLMLEVIQVDDAIKAYGPYRDFYYRRHAYRSQFGRR
jgi:hypothetical protein